MFNAINNKTKLLSIFSILFLFSFIYADPENGCTDLDENTLFLTSSGDVLYNIPTDIAGIQLR